jgi:ATP adenylyltransferase
MRYIKKPKPKGCIFCTKPRQDRDRKNYILYRGTHNFVMMNLYPYTTGHLLITPYRHESKLEALDPDTLLELMTLSQRSLVAIEAVLSPQGFNIGVNMGRVAGAGIEEHFHLHVVPRWNGDTNFMPFLAGVRVIPEHLDETYAKLIPHFKDKKRR